MPKIYIYIYIRALRGCVLFGKNCVAAGFFFPLMNHADRLGSFLGIYVSLLSLSNMQLCWPAKNHLAQRPEGKQMQRNLPLSNNSRSVAARAANTFASMDQSSLISGIRKFTLWDWGLEIILVRTPLQADIPLINKPAST